MLIAALALSPGVGRAQVRPYSAGGDPRFQMVDYRAEQVVQLQAAPGYQLSIEFAPDERIESVAIGDSGAWQVTPNRRGDQLFIKTVQAGTTTNMTVVTDARIYLFDLYPLDRVTPDMAYRVRFVYPRPQGVAEDLPAAAADVAEAYYTLHGDRTLRPSEVSDDGVHTYIEWPASAAIPAIYMVDERGKESLVNGMMRDGFFVIDAVAPRLVFRIDRRSARAVRRLPKSRR
ncbi:TrbG/VirB9 family P-type conjugative transfer protein [Sphingobium lignivorans]|uniref:Type IV secretion system protein VirB9 n=1 Tax=Sphingobium lignivorans TaxID=2735886 RepID=A0ABR6NH92_9SPHN|nr:TrbG/VirB9 family P-type conjugative transfer protein [Sphingobium lignivorans]MBB5986645.1 type IV secretion system protein VirB9 [Sphingobium lignivorans]